jgi:predicted dehydrogenase
VSRIRDTGFQPVQEALKVERRTHGLKARVTFALQFSLEGFMISVGVIGLGMMGLTHLDVYSKRGDVKVVAISDADPARLSGAHRAAGNIAGQAEGSFNFETVAKHADGMQLVNDPQVELVDICLPTTMHFEFGKAALKAGTHMLIEKPLARTAREAMELARIAANSNGLAMCGLCMRFWPGWSWLKDAITRREFGRVLSASFQRLASHPGGPIYSSGALSGGAILDLHIHDTDFVQYCFGPPRAVISRGYSKVTDAIDHVVTQYVYDDVPLVTAEASWCLAPGYGFTMQYLVNFEHATAIFDLSEPQPLTLVRDGRREPVLIPPGQGYEYEIAYFLECMSEGRKPETVTLDSAALSVRIVEAEAQSVRANQPVLIA